MRRSVLWEYVGHPANETSARRQVLYAIVVLRAGLGATFLTLGWNALVAASPEAFAARLGSPARWGLSAPNSADMTLFILGCTELLVGAFQIVGAFTRLTASTGLLLVTAYFALGNVTGLTMVAFPSVIGGLVLLVVCGSPFLSVDRFLDKVEEEERDRAPVTLPASATLATLSPRLGLAASLLMLAWVEVTQVTLGGLMHVAAVVALALTSATLAAGVRTRATGLAGGVLVAFVAARSAVDGRALAFGAVAVGLSLLIAGAGRATLAGPRHARANVIPGDV